MRRTPARALRLLSFLALLLAAGLCSGCAGEEGDPGLMADLEDLGLQADSFWNGADGSGGFTSGPLTFVNAYDAQYASWSGFAASSMRDTTTPGYDNQYSAIAGSGAGGSASFALGYTGLGPARLSLAAGPSAEARFAGAWVCNTTYAYLSMRDGDAYAKEFGGASGEEPDWFRLTVTGLDAAGAQTSAVEFYLADYRGAAAEDHLVDEFTWVDLSALGAVHALELGLDSSDQGEWGMNTPAYFALDRVELAGE
ncbi:MAG TPA: DUF4465 domain-containing protein [Myxococcota bacterium]|nr:DUF4465 domain-containing protein [Myxococcota bacterium]HRY96889.1 DUF4465 domain-containing protein [Myxococcota bacterium]